jgi:hypothetical protein
MLWKVDCNAVGAQATNQSLQRNVAKFTKGEVVVVVARNEMTKANASRRKVIDSIRSRIG